MANSRVIIKDSDTHASRLIKSFQSIKNLDDFSEKPSGVWGSKAIIRLEHSSASVTIDSSELDCEFSIPFDDNLEADEGEIIVYNLSNKTINHLGDMKDISIKAGFEGDTGVIFSGKVTKVASNRDGADKATTIKVIDGVTTTIDEEISMNSTTASEILHELLVMEGSPIAKEKVTSDYAYDNSVTVSGDLQSEIKTHSETCGVSTFKRNGKLYCCKLEDVDNTVAFNVSEETGMIGSPSPFEETVKVGGKEQIIRGFEIEMLLQHRAAVGAVVNLTSEDYKGKYYIKSGEHRFNNSEAITKIKVVE